MFFIASHAVFDKKGNPMHGTGSEIATFLENRKISYFFIKHPLCVGQNTLVEKYLGGRKKSNRYGSRSLPFLLTRVQDQLITFYLLLKTKEKPLVFIGIDPFNGFSAVVAKWLGLIKYAVFYTADYAHRRFENVFMNSIYHWFDRFCIKHADQVWNVSTRIVKQRRKQGVLESKNIFVPNTPEFRKTKRTPLSKLNKHDIVIVSNLTSSLNYDEIFGSVKKLSKKFQDLRLLIIGEGESEGKLKNVVEDLKISDRVMFLGRRPHEEVLDILSKSAVGLAIYTKDNTWTEFGDSMKVREYLACGLPVVMNEIVSTADDMVKENAGFVLRDRKGKNKHKNKTLYKAIDKIFSDDSLYVQMRKNAIRLAKKYDFTNVIEKALRKIDPVILGK